MSITEKCKKCGLSASASSPVNGIGPESADIMLVGEAPGAEEDRQGMPFVGDAGKLLDRILSTVGLNREELYITNTCKCRPPGNRPPAADEIKTCFPYLKKEILTVNPVVIVTLGRTATSAFEEIRSISKEVGIVRDVEIDGRIFYLIPAFHPAYFLRQRNNVEDKYKMVDALKAATVIVRAIKEFNIGEFGRIIKVVPKRKENK